MKVQKVLFLHVTLSHLPDNYWAKLKVKDLQFCYAEPGVAWVAQALAHYLDVHVLDCDFLTDEEILSCINSYQPDVIGISSYTAGWPRTEKIVSRLNPKIRIIFGGWHVSLPGMAKQTLTAYPDATVVTGRGEGTIAIFQNPRDYNGQIINGDSIPGTRRYPFSISTRRPYFNFIGTPQHHVAASILFRGGCTFECSYCPSNTGLAPSRNIKEVIDEIEFLVRSKGVNFIFVRDENPLLYPELIKQICEELVARKLNDKVKFHMFGDIRLIKSDIMHILQEAGWTGLTVGIEHITEQGRKSLGRQHYWDVMLKAFDGIRQAKLFINAGLMLWCPGDTLDTFDQTINGLCKLQPDSIMLTFFTPFPGIEKELANLPRRTNDLRDYHYFYPILVNNPSVSDSELIVQRWRVLEKYYRSKEYAQLMKMRRIQLGESAFQNLTEIKRQRLLKYKVDIWQS